MPLTLQKVFFQTSDGIKICASYWPKAAKKAVILVHQFNNSKESFNGLAQLLNENGYAVLAIDLRGHGESKASGSLASPVFLTEKDFLDMELDLKAALDFLREKKFENFFFAGASIGANLAVMFPHKNKGFAAAVALSPGENYKGLQPLLSAKKTSVPTMIIASKEDAYSNESAQKIFDALTCQKKFLQLQNAGHGTNMFNGKPELEKEILGWFNQF